MKLLQPANQSFDGNRKNNLSLIDHGDGFITRYDHNSKKYLVKVGDRIKRGELISQSGNTGRITGPHLHYSVMLNGIPVNPASIPLNK
jgi:murein DD-endopeptidase MepM/ murein hydrolase activator NlpD